MSENPKEYKSLMDIIRKGEFKFYLEEGALGEDDFAETESDGKRIVRYTRIWLTQKWRFEVDKKPIIPIARHERIALLNELLEELK